MRRKLITSLVGIVVLAAGLLTINVSLGYKPALGLDLRGGISVTLRPVDSDYTQQSLDLAVERIRERVDSKGVGEPEIIRQDNAIVVNLPGVNDRQAALDLVKVSGKVELRPVLGCYTPAPTTTSTTTAGSDTATTTAGTTAATGTGSATTVGGATVGSGSTASTPAPGPSRNVHSVPPSDGSSTTAPGATSTTVAGDATSTTVAGDATSTTVVSDATTTTVTSDTVLPPDQSGTLATRDGQACSVGPSGGDGTVFEKDSALAQIIGGGWGVTVTLKTGSSGEGVWNALAAECYAGQASGPCPSHQLAIVLDGQIQSAPTVNAPSFTGSVQITGKFTQGEASQLAQVLNSGALPVTLKAEQVENVSASLGKDSLRAALIAGAIGIALVILFMILYYRRLAVVVVAGMLISGALVYSMTSLISRFYNGVLSLSGIAGLIVSIGVTIDSYVVFFERLKDEVRAGRSLRNSAQRGFRAAFRTILLADAVSLIGAAVLYYLSVGAVRGFAFYLGLSTVTDIFVAYFFTRPAVLLLARSRFMGGHHVLGLSADNDSSVQISGATT
ncbi:MAG: secD [Ilumatobacteraceae bacterium]|nr:secD [Ilumatobacteraceae bacterium]